MTGTTKIGKRIYLLTVFGVLMCPFWIQTPDNKLYNNCFIPVVYKPYVNYYTLKIHWTFWSVTTTIKKKQPRFHSCTNKIKIAFRSLKCVVAGLTTMGPGISESRPLYMLTTLVQSFRNEPDIPPMQLRVASLNLSQKKDLVMSTSCSTRRKRISVCRCWAFFFTIGYFRMPSSGATHCFCGWTTWRGPPVLPLSALVYAPVVT